MKTSSIKGVLPGEAALLNPATGEVTRLSPGSPLNVQVAGGHYVGRAIQPIEFIQANRLGFIEGSVVKYMVRWRDKNGIEDLKKARHYLDLLIELETAETA